jgi:hypothetical protein
MAGFERYRTVSAVLLEELSKPYEYGVADCFMLGCRVADALDGTLGLAALYGGAYSTLTGAQRALRRHGFKSLAELFGSHLPPVAPAAAQTGDLAILRLSDGDHVGVIAYAAVVTKTERGRSSHPVAAAVAAFRTGGG